MTINKYSVTVKNEDRGTEKTKYFDNFHLATDFYGTVDRIEGDRLSFSDLDTGATIATD